MDPNELLNQIRELLKRRNLAPMTTDEALENGHELAQKIQDMDNWMSKGGFPPEPWSAWITDTQRKFKDQAKTDK